MGLFFDPVREALVEHKVECRERYAAIDNKLEQLPRRLAEQDVEMRRLFEIQEAKRASSMRGIYALLWTVTGSVVLLLITGMSILIYGLLPNLHAVH